MTDLSLLHSDSAAKQSRNQSGEFWLHLFLII